MRGIGESILIATGSEFIVKLGKTYSFLTSKRRVQYWSYWSYASFVPMNEIVKTPTRRTAQIVGHKMAPNLLVRSCRIDPISESVRLCFADPFVITGKENVIFFTSFSLSFGVTGTTHPLGIYSPPACSHLRWPEIVRPLPWASTSAAGVPGRSRVSLPPSQGALFLLYPMQAKPGH